MTFCVQVIYTYDVKWERSDVRWSHRWDIYLKGNPDDEIHYFSIVNSLMIVLFLTGVVAMIMLRTLHKDINSYNEMQTLEEAQEESGWKLVHGDVFRPPTTSPMMLSVFAGDEVLPSSPLVSPVSSVILSPPLNTNTHSEAISLTPTIPFSLLRLRHFF